MTKPSVTEIDKLIGQRLKTLRQQHKVSAAALAEVMETSQQKIYRYERGLKPSSIGQQDVLLTTHAEHSGCGASGRCVFTGGAGALHAPISTVQHGKKGACNAPLQSRPAQ